MNFLTKNKLAVGVVGVIAIVSIVNTQAILKLTNFASVNNQNQTAQVGSYSSKTGQNNSDLALKSGGFKSLSAPSITRNSLCNKNTAPWVRVTSPNGGEVYQAGQQIDVTWDSCNIPVSTPMFIAFNAASTEHSGGYTVTMSAPNDGSEQITLPPASDFGTNQGNWFYGLHYKVGVGISNPADGNDRRDYSDNLFSITDGIQTACNTANIHVTRYSPMPNSVTVTGPSNPQNQAIVAFNVDNNSGCDLTFKKASIGTFFDRGNESPFGDLYIYKDYGPNFMPSAQNYLGHTLATNQSGDGHTNLIIGYQGTQPYVIADGDSVNLVVMGDAGFINPVADQDPSYYDYHAAAYLQSLGFITPGGSGIIVNNQNDFDGVYSPIFRKLFGGPVSCSITPELISISQTASQQGPGQADLGTFKIRYKITAQNCDTEISSNSGLSTGANTPGDGQVYSITAGSNNYTNTTPASVVTCVSGCNPITGGFLVEDGDNAIFSLNVAFQPQNSGLFKVNLESINWGTDGNYQNFYSTGLTDYHTNYISLSAN